MKPIIEQIKKKHPQYASHPLMELLEHYAKEYDRELSLVIEVELRKFVRWLLGKEDKKDIKKYRAKRRLLKGWLGQYLEGGKSDGLRWEGTIGGNPNNPFPLKDKL
jgi:hypothetical protein